MGLPFLYPLIRHLLLILFLIILRLHVELYVRRRRRCPARNHPCVRRSQPHPSPRHQPLSERPHRQRHLPHRRRLLPLAATRKPGQPRRDDRSLRSCHVGRIRCEQSVFAHAGNGAQ